MLRHVRTTVRGLVQRLRDPSGFGLIEMTIALMMLAIGIAALGGLFVTGHLALRRASKQDTATVLAGRMLEQFRAIKFSDIALSSSLVSSADGTYTSDAALGGTSDITTSGSPCSLSPVPITCKPSRSIPDTAPGGTGETAADGQTYR